MERIKEDLTKLIDSINSKFPDGNDLKNFLGISKGIITDSLMDSGALLVALKEYDNNFETIFLKRELADLIGRINRDLEEDFDKMKPNQFNSLLKNVSKIRFQIKETYLSLTHGQPIRTEAEIARAKEDLTLLNSYSEELKAAYEKAKALQISTGEDIGVAGVEVRDLKISAERDIQSFRAEVVATRDLSIKDIKEWRDEINSLFTSSKTIVEKFEEKQKSSTEQEQKINAFLEQIKVHEATLKGIETNTIQWQQDIKNAKDEIASSSSEYSALNTKSKEIQNEIEESHAKIFGREENGKLVKGYLQETEELKNQIESFLKDQNSKYLSQFNEIEGLLPGATSTGLAEAYQNQKLSYKLPILLWSIIFILTMCAMAGLSVTSIYYQFKDHISLTLNEAFISLLKDLPFFIPTIWLAAYASKQQSQFKRLQQEYAFKETNAKSFHGHKRQIEELKKDGVEDNDLLLELVAQLVAITSQNPSSTLDNKAHEDNSPIFKFMEKFMQKREKKKLPEENKLS